MLFAVIGSLEHPISSLFVDGSLTANEGSSGEGTASNPYDLYNSDGDEPGGGSGETILLFVNTLFVGESGVAVIADFGLAHEITSQLPYTEYATRCVRVSNELGAEHPKSTAFLCLDG
uniref:Glycine-rich protein n=1 Tax=Tanacetum cinerariifolium TaxID=118510 RepID=A0A6L2M6K1_TANCI|nr:glycine-rich protein [Tanacetum cinerariifolium]